MISMYSRDMRNTLTLIALFILGITISPLAAASPDNETLVAAENYINLQICSYTESEYRKNEDRSNELLDISGRIEGIFITEEMLDQFIAGIQQAHDAQADIEVYEGETRESFYRRVFNEDRCARESVIGRKYLEGVQGEN